MSTQQTSLLSKSTRFLTNHGFDVMNVQTDLIEDLGKTHVVLNYAGEDFSMRAKEYRYKGRASFGVEQVEQAAEEGHTLLSYIKKDDSFYVFDAEYVEDAGNVYEQPSKHSISREWIEVPASSGVGLTAYLKDEDEPETLAGDNSRLSSFQ